MKLRVTTVLALVTGVSLVVGCGSSSTSNSDQDTVTLVTHDSFAASKKVLEEFTDRTGYTVRVLRGGDAGSAVNQAVLNKDNPQGDVFFGVDNTLLSRALENDVFESYEAKDLAKVPKELRADPKRNRVSPVDTGEVCVNYDRQYFADRKLEPPRSFDDLIQPRYKDLLVTENAATSSPGLGFLLATVRKYGSSGWQSYWKELKANGVEVVDGWEQAYNDRFSGSAAGKGKGDRPLVVSYASSPPVEVLGEKERPEQAPTGVVESTCFRQTEFAGLLSGAANQEGGKALLDFLLSKTFQEDLPLRMFVNPVRTDAELPKVFTRYGETVEDPLSMLPKRIANNREHWLDTWTSLVLR